jgi:rSAM/selenodomain-associated transferase 2
VCPPLCSIIICLYREQESIDACLKHLCTLRKVEQSEVILVDGDGGSTLEAVPGGSYPFRLVELISPCGRGVQLHAGAEAAAAEILLFLHVDTLLPRTGLELVGRTLASYDAGAFSLGIIGAGPLFNAWLAYINERKRLSFSPYGDQAMFMTRNTYRLVGGFPSIPIMEDVVMTERLKRGGFRLKLLHSRVLTSARRWRKRGYFLNFLKNTGIYALHRVGVSPWTLARYYRPDPASSWREGVEAKVQGEKG